MTGIMNREFEELAQNGLNYLTWASDVEIVLEGRKIRGALVAGTPTAPSTTTAADNANALHFLRHHMSPTLKMSIWPNGVPPPCGPPSKRGSQG